MAKHKDSGEYLANHGIRRTSFRIELLELFMKNDHSLSHRDITKKITNLPDKVTIYRALDSFEEKGLIHKVPDANNVARYALCSHQCSSESHDHDHIHFVCNSCEETYCLDQTKVPTITLPVGYRINNIHLTVSGICDACTV